CSLTPVQLLVKSGKHGITQSFYKFGCISCPENKDVHFTIKWILRFSPCAEEYVMFDEDGIPPKMKKLNMTDNTETDTDENGGDDNEVPPPEDADETGDETNEGAGTSASQQPAKPGSAQRKKRADPAAGQKTDTKSTSTPAKTISTTTPAPAVTAKTEQHSAIVGRTWRSGYYVLILELKNLESDSEKPTGMLEKAVFYTDFQSIANTGNPVSKSTIVVAEVVSCLKRALARMLIIIVSVGFGTVKPRLGPTFHKVLFVGGLYFILGSIEGCMRALKAKADQSNDQMLAAVPLAVLDASICCIRCENKKKAGKWLTKNKTDHHRGRFEVGRGKHSINNFRQGPHLDR
ncbi:TM87A-like protein, partial [Mya arenaria]